MSLTCRDKVKIGQLVIDIVEQFIFIYRFKIKVKILFLTYQYFFLVDGIIMPPL